MEKLRVDGSGLKDLDLRSICWTRLCRRPGHALRQVTELPVTAGPSRENRSVDTATTAASCSP